MYLKISSVKWRPFDKGVGGVDKTCPKRLILSDCWAPAADTILDKPLGSEPDSSVLWRKSVSSHYKKAWKYSKQQSYR